MSTFRLVGVMIFLAAVAPATVQPQEFAAGVRESKSAVPARNAEPLSPEDRGDIYMARKMYREAVDAYREVNPPTAIIYNKLGIAHQQMADLGTAKKYYDRALKLNPQYAEAINNVGTVHYSRKSYRRAVTSYKKALRFAPSSASIYSNLGTAYFGRKDYKQASECYEHAVALDPEVFEHHSNQGALLQERSVDERAKFHYFLARTYAKAGRDDLALQYIRKSLEEGFKDRNKYMEESEFAKLRQLPQFAELMKLEPRVL